eukprot:9419280-Alexandrium_andersonii.AAC.1
MGKAGSGANAQPDEAAVQASQKGRAVLFRAWLPESHWRPPTARPSLGGAPRLVPRPKAGCRNWGCPTLV